MMKKKAVYIGAAVLSLALAGCGSSSEKSLLDINPDKYETLGDYKGVEAVLESIDVSESDIEEAVNNALKSVAEKKEVTGRPVKEGDIVNIDYEGKKDGVAFEGGKGEDYPLTIGSGAFIPGFEDQLVGAEIGKEVEVNVTFPENYQAEELKGKDAVFKCTVKEIKEKELPELDDEFAGEVSEFETLAEYREDVRKKLSEQKETEAKREKEDKAIDAVIEDSDMEIPEAMIETQQRQMVDEFAQRIQMQGLTLDQYFKFTGNSHEMLLEQVKPQAEKRIKSRLVLEAVVEKENIEVSEDDYTKEVERMAEMYQMEADKVREMLGEDEKKNVMKDIAIQKAVEFVAENAKEE